MEKKNCIETLKAIVPELRDRFGVITMTLFGSYAKDMQTDESDIDLYVETATPNPRLILGMRDYISTLMGVDVDIVRKHSGLNPYLLRQIQTNGILLF